MIDFRLAACDWTPQEDSVIDDAPPTVLVGLSGAIERLRRDILRAACRANPVVIVGEPGSGKSLVARALHQQGPRATDGCAMVACHARPAAALEGEIFGSGVEAPGRPASDVGGLLRSPATGTVVFERANVLGERTRALLAALVKERCRPPEIPSLVEHRSPRVIVTCAVDAESASRIHAEIAAELGATTIHVPSLRERRADIPLLARSFAAACERGGGPVVFSAAAMSALTSYSWPGNVRQLRQVVERMASCAGAGEIAASELPVGIRPRPQRNLGGTSPGSSVGEALFTRVRSSGESFWSSVYPLFMKREITRADLRDVIRRAREVAPGEPDDLVRVLNMPRSDSRRFLRFLRKYDCELGV